MLNINSIYKEFTTKKLFEDLSFRIEPGMRLGLVGPNGSGKSTLLKKLTSKYHENTISNSS